MQPVLNATTWRTRRYDCQIAKIRVVEIWSDNGSPWIPGNAYLRDTSRLRQWETATVSAYASELVHLAQWLTDNRVSFWNEDLRLGGHAMVAFRDFLFDRTAFDAGSEEATLQVSTTSRIMGNVLNLCRYWKADDEKIRGDRGHDLASPGSRRRTRRPPAFAVRGRAVTSRGRESLTPDEIDSIWTHLYVDRRPPRRWNRVDPKLPWQLQTAFWARDCMLWALLISTGLRRGEVPAVMREDVQHHTNAGWWIHLRDPREERVVNPQRRRVFDYGAKLKTGSRDVIVLFEDIFEEAYRHWIQWRPLLVGMSGQPDHGMLLVSNKGGRTRIGSPLTYEGMETFFDRINEGVGPFEGDAGAQRFRLTAHRIRHTLESIMKSNRMPIAHRQATLGHKRADTTEHYGTVYRTDLVATRTRLHERLRSDHPHE